MWHHVPEDSDLHKATRTSNQNLQPLKELGQTCYTKCNKWWHIVVQEENMRGRRSRGGTSYHAGYRKSNLFSLQLLPDNSLCTMPHQRLICFNVCSSFNQVGSPMLVTPPKRMWYCFPAHANACCMSSHTAHLIGMLLQQLRLLLDSPNYCLLLLLLFWLLLLLLLLFNEDRLLLGSIWCCDGLHSIHQLHTRQTCCDKGLPSCCQHWLGSTNRLGTLWSNQLHLSVKRSPEMEAEWKSYLIRYSPFMGMFANLAACLSNC